MKISKTVSVLIAVLLLCSLFSFNAGAASSEVIYKNDFSAGDSAIDDTFDVYRGLLSIAEEKENKFLRCNQESAKIHFAYGPTDVSNVDVSFRLRATTINDNNNSRVEAMFRSPHIPAWETVSYNLQMRTYQADLIYGDRFADDGERLSLASSEDFKIKSGLWNNIQISTRGERMIIYVNGVQLFEYSDNRYGIAGGFGFSASSMSFDVDDIVITKHYGATPPNPTANRKPEWSGDISEAEEADIPDTGIIRIDLTTLGQEKVAVSNAIHFLNPYELTVYTWVALGIGLVCLMGALLGIILVLKRKRAEEDSE